VGGWVVGGWEARLGRGRGAGHGGILGHGHLVGGYAVWPEVYLPAALGSAVGEGGAGAVDRDQGGVQGEARSSGGGAGFVVAFQGQLSSRLALTSSW